MLNLFAELVSKYGLVNGREIQMRRFLGRNMNDDLKARLNQLRDRLLHMRRYL